MTTRERKLRIENHPDRWGGDHSRMDKVFEALKIRRSTMREVLHCSECGVTISRGSRCMVHARMKKPALISAMFLMSALLSFAQRGAQKYDYADKLTWTNGTNSWPVFTEIQGQVGSKAWKTLSVVRNAQSITLPRDARVVRYRVSHVFEVTGVRSTWCYKSTK